MYPAKLIATLFVKKAIDEGKPITQMKLQKLVYFAQGVNLVKYNQPLISEDIQAWKFGPVVPAIYDGFKFYGNLPITNLDKVKLDGVKLNNVPSEVKDVIDYSWEATKHLNAIQLSNWTHQDGSPWQKVYNPYDWAIPIDNSTIKNYFIDFLGNQ